MKSSHPFISFILQHANLGAEELHVLSEHLSVKRYQAGDILLAEGSVSNVSYFNVKGCVRQYYIIEGIEKTVQFYTESEFINSRRSFMNRIPADHYLECLEDCDLVPIRFDLEKELINKYPKLQSFIIKVLEDELARYQEL